jgi:hypothetical protein
LKADLRGALVEEITPDGWRRRFHLPDVERSEYRGQLAVSVEGTVLDADGATVAVILYVDGNDRLYELELLRESDGDVIEPNWDSLPSVDS